MQTAKTRETKYLKKNIDPEEKKHKKRDGERES